jgi:hypothetical protein
MAVTVESCTSINIHTLQKAIKKSIKRDYLEPTDDDIYTYSLQGLKGFTVNGQTFDYTAQKNYLGGYRWFFICPKCKKKANKLFLPPDGTNREHTYACKMCHKLKNQSALMSQNALYRKVTRPLKIMKLLENKIAKGHLKVEKVQEMLDEYERLEKQLKDAPEFRLYAFKKKHGLL